MHRGKNYSFFYGSINYLIILFIEFFLYLISKNDMFLEDIISHLIINGGLYMERLQAAET